MIYGIGVDLVEIQRMTDIIKKWGSRFVTRVFSQGETDYCNSRAFPAIHFAARFAAKESFLKSLGMGLGMGVNLREIEVSQDKVGKPGMMLQGRAAEILSGLGIESVHLSLTHTRHSAAAMVILEKV